MKREAIVDRLRCAIHASVEEVRKDPEFMGRVVSTVCVEFGLDQFASLYLSNKLKTMVSRSRAE